MEKRVVTHIVGKAFVPQTDDYGVEVTELENPYGENSDGGPVLPVIVLRGQRTRNGYPMGVVSYARDLNKISSKAFMNYFHGAAHLINSPIIQTDDARWEGNPGTPPGIMGTKSFRTMKVPGGSKDRKFSPAKGMVQAAPEGSIVAKQTKPNRSA